MYEQIKEKIEKQIIELKKSKLEDEIINNQLVLDFIKLAEVLNLIEPNSKFNQNLQKLILGIKIDKPKKPFTNI